MARSAGDNAGAPDDSGRPGAAADDVAVAADPADAELDAAEVAAALAELEAQEAADGQRRVVRWRRRTFIEMLVSGVISLIASFVLSVEALHLAANPDGDLSCDINSVLACGAVGKSWAATIIADVPNAFFGLIAEAVVITIAVASIGGVRFPRWFMRAAQVVYTIGLAFAYFLFSYSFFFLHKLCPWCLLITLSTTVVWVGLTRINVNDGALSLPGALGRRWRTFVSSGADWIVTTAWLLVILAAILLRYGVALFA